MKMVRSLIYLNYIVTSLGGSATEEYAELIAHLFHSIGKIWRTDEKLFNAVIGRLRYEASVII